MLWLIPFNMLMVYGTFKYCMNIHKISNYLWPNLKKVKISNLFIVSTMQAMGFTTIYVGGTLIVLGVNPVKKYREMQEMNEAMANMPVTDNLIGPDGKLDESEFDKLSDGQKKMLRTLNSFGISNQQILEIEKEMRKQ